MNNSPKDSPFHASGDDSQGPISFGEYQLLQVLGRGGMGIVYRAWQASLQRHVALKMILEERLTDEAAVRRFEREARAIGSLDHPHIVSVYESGEIAGRHYFTMQLVAGDTLADRLRQGPFLPNLAAAFMHKLALALAYAHEQQVIHRDLKPANILIDAHDEPRITDFGLARHLEYDQGNTVTTDFVGTAAYCSPEQAGSGESMGPPSDIYSLGCILYALLVGHPPFQSYSTALTIQMLLKQKPIPPRRINPRIPVDLETICLKCLEKGTRDRYATTRDMANDLQAFLELRPILARRPSLLHRCGLWCHKHPLVLLVAMLTLALTIALLSESKTGRRSFPPWRSPPEKVVQLDLLLRENLKQHVQQVRAQLATERTELSNRHVLEHPEETSSFLRREVGTMLLSLWCQDHQASLDDSARLESQLASYPIARCYLLLHRVESLVALRRQAEAVAIFSDCLATLPDALAMLSEDDRITLRKQIALAKLRLSPGTPAQQAAALAEYQQTMAQLQSASRSGAASSVGLETGLSGSPSEPTTSSRTSLPELGDLVRQLNETFAQGEATDEHWRMNMRQQMESLQRLCHHADLSPHDGRVKELGELIWPSDPQRLFQVARTLVGDVDWMLMPVSPRSIERKPTSATQ